MHLERTKHRGNLGISNIAFWCPFLEFVGLHLDNSGMRLWDESLTVKLIKTHRDQVVGSEKLDKAVAWLEAAVLRIVHLRTRPSHSWDPSPHFGQKRLFLLKDSKFNQLPLNLFKISPTPAVASFIPSGSMSPELFLALRWLENTIATR